LPRLVGEARAKEMILLGRKISAATAAAYGLASYVVPRDKLASTVEGCSASSRAAHRSR